jgi:hypothetical protein
MKFFGFGSSTPPPPPPPNKPPASPPKPANAPTASPAKPAHAPTPSKPAAPEAPSIVGRWKDPDGSVTEKTGAGETIRGRYSLRDKQLNVKLDGMTDELSFPVAIGPDTLEMTDADGKVTLYRRIS